MYDISIVCPGIRAENWEKIYQELTRELDSFEFIIVGPTIPSETLLKNSNVTYIECYGHPTYCVQIASYIAAGKLFTWLSDDITIYTNGLKELIAQFDLTINRNDEFVVRYVEIPQHGSPNMPDAYWTAHFHASLRLSGIPITRHIAPVGLLTLSRFKQLGGFDCRFNHINMSCIDLSLRIQQDGNQVIIPDITTYKCMWASPQDQIFLVNIYNTIDYPVFYSIYENPTNRITIDYSNWIYEAPIWKARFGEIKW